MARRKFVALAQAADERERAEELARAAFEARQAENRRGTLPLYSSSSPSFASRRTSTAAAAAARAPASAPASSFSSFEATSRFFGNVPTAVRICEVGPRDGLQNEPKDRIVKLEDKFRLIQLLREAGVTRIEAGSFVAAPRVPQMADSGELLQMLVADEEERKRNADDSAAAEGEEDKSAAVVYPVLVPNLKGLERAIESGAEEVALFAAASEAFSQANTNMSIEKALERAKEVTEVGRQLKPGLRFRGYVSTVLGCPYEGAVPIAKVVEVAHRLYDLGAFEISLGDTIGSGTPGRVYELLDALLASGFPPSALAAHFHDTYGQALANTLMALQFGVEGVDSSVAGLGGCPYAKGATGNLATEDLVFMLHGTGISTGIDLPKLIEAGWFISERLGKRSKARVSSAFEAKGELPVTYYSEWER